MDERGRSENPRVGAQTHRSASHSRTRARETHTLNTMTDEETEPMQNDLDCLLPTRSFLSEGTQTLTNAIDCDFDSTIFYYYPNMCSEEAKLYFSKIDPIVYYDTVLGIVRTIEMLYKTGNNYCTVGPYCIWRKILRIIHVCEVLGNYRDDRDDFDDFEKIFEELCKIIFDFKKDPSTGKNAIVWSRAIHYISLIQNWSKTHEF